MIVNAKGLDRLAKRAAEADNVLVGRVQRSALQINGAVAWGQFLDDPNKVRQFGIYGTSAAVRILAGAGHTENSPLISKALRGLPEVNPPDTGESLYDKSDLSITFKATSLLEAAQPLREQFDTPEPVETRLINQIIDSHGWGNYYDTSDQDDAPRILPTAHALLALRRSRSFRKSANCESILVWFCEEARRGAPLPVHEAALALLVLIEYRGEGAQVALHQATHSELLRQLTRWAQQDRGVVLAETASNHYWSVKNNIHHNQYLFYVPDILGALALLRAGNPAKGRRRVLAVIAALSEGIIAKQGFRSATSRRIASVDQLWACLLLRQFITTHQTQPKILLGPVAHIISAVPLYRGLATGVLVLTGGLGTLCSIMESLHVVVRATGGTFAAVCLGLLVSLWFVWARGD